MSTVFPTHKQFIADVRARLKRQYPDERGPRLHDTVKMQTGEQAWLAYLGDLIRKGVPIDKRVIDGMTPEQKTALITIYAPEDCLDAYFLGKLRGEGARGSSIREGEVCSK